MQSRPKFDDIQAEEIRKKYESGGSIEGLAKEYGASGSTIARTIRRVGGQIRTGNYLTKKFTPEVDNKLREKYEAGVLLQDLAIEYSAHSSTVSAAIKRAGGTTRPPGFAKGSRKRKNS